MFLLVLFAVSVSGGLSDMYLLTADHGRMFLGAKLVEQFAVARTALPTAPDTAGITIRVQ
jgi:hypothetical protein